MAAMTLQINFRLPSSFHRKSSPLDIVAVCELVGGSCKKGYLDIAVNSNDGQDSPPPYFSASPLPRCRERGCKTIGREPFWDPLSHRLTPLQKLFFLKIEFPLKRRRW